MPRKPPPASPEPLPGLVPLPVAVDLIRFEKNLLQIGFFGAHDTRHSNQSTRRIEQLVSRNGQRMKVAAEFRASQELGLPSTSDRDKYIAFMKIAMERRTQAGRIENPIRFTGYRLLKELGLSFSGENYEDINRWGQRMADTTITSEQVIYMAARKKYANKTVHVFRSFQRTGQSDTDGSGRAESYEVVLEDWLLENLNQSFVVPEDFNAYRSLRRPTAKGIFGYLHLWFHASRGRAVEKDYAELCMLLNIPVYRHASKIRDTMGKSLDELASVGYLSEWDIRPMSTKEGYKLVLVPGAELSHVLAVAQRKIDDGVVPEQQMDAEHLAALKALEDRGVSPAKAAALVRQFPPDSIQDRIEYAEHLIATDRRGKLDNPAGFLIYAIESQLPVPAGFVTSRKLRLNEAERAGEARAAAELAEAQARFEQYIEAQIEEELERRFPGPNLAKRLKQVVKQQIRPDMRDRMSPAQQEAYARQLLRSELRETLPLPSFESWCDLREQMPLF
jgi:hypothetical protein